MKFTQTLQLNAVPEWIDFYVSYETLKKLIFQIERENVANINLNEDPEVCYERKQNSEEQFLSMLDIQLGKVCDFYTEKESELYGMVDQLDAEVNGDTEKHLAPLEQIDSTLHHQPNSINEQDPISNRRRSSHVSHRSSIRRSSTHRFSVSGRRPSRISMESRMTVGHDGDDDDDDIVIEQLSALRSQLILLYISLSELESYVELNRTAFEKILKKHDKVLDGNLKQVYLEKMVKDSRPFMPETTETLRAQLTRVELLFANAFCGGNRVVAIRQMKTHLRDQITFERNTVWKEMIRQERKTHDTKLIEPGKDETYKLPFTELRVKKAIAHQIISFLFCVVVFIILLSVDCFGSKPENYCFAIMIFAALMWATEAIPLYATSFIIPFLIVSMGVLRNADGTVMTAKEASKSTFSSMFSDTIMMLLGGFALAAALSKYGIAKAFASHVLSRAGTRPMWVLLAIMCVSIFLSMFISNVATPVLCFSLIDPILRTLPDRSSVAPCLILGIALASCIGGMASPISSPQNIVTIQYMDPAPGWGVWFAVALPVAILTMVACWGLLLAVYRPARETPHLNRIRPTKEKITKMQVYVVLITLLTIALWCAESPLEYALGSMGVIATIPLFLFFGTGVLNKEDLNNFLWSVVVLAQGGMALGNAVTSSGLLEDIATRLRDAISDFSIIGILAIFSFLILVFATFVSHTVAALIIIPIVQQVGLQLPSPHPNLLVMGSGLACSAGMGLPVSGYPNMSAVMLEDPSGKTYLTSKDFLITGVPVSIFCTILIFTLGYGIMTGLGY